MPISNTLDASNALLAWVRPDWDPATTSGTPTVLSVGSAGNTRFSLGIKADYSGITLGSGTAAITCAANLARGAWRQITAVVENGQATMYLDGTPLGQQAFVPGTAHGQRLHISSAFGQGSYFTGQIDEAGLYSRALSLNQVLAIAQPASNNVKTLEIGFVHAKDWENPLSIAWAAVTLDQPNSPFSSWSYPLPQGLEGPYQIYLRAADNFNQVRVIAIAWRGDIDTEAPRVTQTSTPVVVNGQTLYDVQCTAEDYNLVASTFVCPAGGAPTLTYQNAAWFIALFGAARKLAAMQSPLVRLASPGAAPQVCDSFNNCVSGAVYRTFSPVVKR